MLAHIFPNDTFPNDMFYWKQLNFPLKFAYGLVFDVIENVAFCRKM